jgi:adenylylsulfate kinase-like enzyme
VDGTATNSRAGACVWLTGRRGAGRTTVGRLVASELDERDVPNVLLDENDTGVLEHLRLDAAGTPLPAVAWLAALFAQRGVIAIVTVDAPGRAARDDVRAMVERFVEVHVDTPAEVCAERRGKIGAYEEPFAAELRVPTHDRSPAASAAQVISYLESSGILD